MLLTLLFIGAVNTPACDRPALVDRDPVSHWLTVGLDHTLEAVLAGESANTRDLSNAAFTALLIKNDAVTAQKLLERLLKSQLVSAEHGVDTGGFPWNEHETRATDRNALELASQSLGPLLKLYGHCLPPNLLVAWRSQLMGVLIALERDVSRVGIDATSMWLLNAEATILLGEWLNDKTAVDSGIGALDTATAFFEQSGISEYDNPTAYGIALNALSLIDTFSDTPAAKQKSRRLLDLLWTDIAGNFFAPRQDLSGPKSRDENFLHGDNGIDAQLVSAGWRQPGLVSDHTHLDLEKSAIAAVLAFAGYRPGPALGKLRDQGDKVITAHYDASAADSFRRHASDSPQTQRPDHREPGWQRYNYVTSAFAVGTASATMGTQDRSFAIELAGDEQTAIISPVVSIVSAGQNGDAYGLVKTTDCSGHRQASHFPQHLVAAQDHGRVMGLLVSELDRPKCHADDADPPAPTRIVTSFLLPLGNKVVLSVDGHPIEPTRRPESLQPWPVGKDGIVSVRLNGSVALLRLFGANTCAGGEIETMVVVDGEGYDHHVARLDIFHYVETGKKSDVSQCHPRLGFIAEVMRDSELDQRLVELQHAVVDEHYNLTGDDSDWRASVTLGTTKLEVYRRDRWKNHHEPLLAERKVNGVAMSFFPLGINGDDVMAQLLGGSPAATEK